MQNTDGLTPMDKELEAALGGLRVVGATLSRDEILFGAGRASARRRNRLWQGVSSALAVLLLLSLIPRSRTGTLEPSREVAVHQRPSVPPAPLEQVDSERAQAFRQYIRTRRAVLDRGVEAIEASSGTRDSFAPPLTRESLDELLSST